jgi:predicted aldo/keto reductase-like oxidoreductase
MKTTRLGRTDIEVSRIGIGGIPIQRPPEEKAIEVIKHALDLGINLIDTSLAYGTSEERIGKAILGRREEITLITKTWTTDRNEAMMNLESSLKNFHTKYIDVWELHNVSTMEKYQAILAEGGSLEAVKEARETGKTKFIGISSHNIEIMKSALESEIFDVILFPFNFVNNEAANTLVPMAKKLDIGFTAMKPFAGGRLRDANLVMKYLLQFDNVIPVPGVEKKEEVEELVDIVEGRTELTKDDENKIENIKKELGTHFCQYCGYCMPTCPQELYIPVVINLRISWELWPQETFKERYEDLIKTAKTCTECGICEEKCPYSLPIREKIQEGIEFYESIVKEH